MKYLKYAGSSNWWQSAAICAPTDTRAFKIVLSFRDTEPRAVFASRASGRAIRVVSSRLRRPLARNSCCVAAPAAVLADLTLAGTKDRFGENAQNLRATLELDFANGKAGWLLAQNGA